MQYEPLQTIVDRAVLKHGGKNKFFAEACLVRHQLVGR